MGAGLRRGGVALLQGVDIVAAKFGWPDPVERILIVVLCIGSFVIVLIRTDPRFRELLKKLKPGVFFPETASK